MSIYSRSPSPPNRGAFNAGSGSDGEVERRSTHSGSDDDAGRRRSQSPENSEDEEDKKKKEKEKKKSNKPKGPVRRQVISDDMLTGTKGLSKLSESFSDFEFQGKGKEKEDLNRMLNKIEQWVHTLHPKHPFDQSLERIEILGIKKKSIKTYLKKMRMGMLPTMSAETVDPRFDDDDNVFPTENEDEFPDIPEQEHHQENAANSQNETVEPSTSSQTQDYGDIPTFEEQMELEEDLMSGI